MGPADQPRAGVVWSLDRAVEKRHRLQCAQRHVLDRYFLAGRHGRFSLWTADAPIGRTDVGAGFVTLDDGCPAGQCRAPAAPIYPRCVLALCLAHRRRTVGRQPGKSEYFWRATRVDVHLHRHRGFHHFVRKAQRGKTLRSAECLLGRRMHHHSSTRGNDR